MITTKQIKNAPYTTTDNLARAMYDAYCVAVGGHAYDGRPLPTSEEFFEDASKATQAGGWYAAASKALEIILKK